MKENYHVEASEDAARNYLNSLPKAVLTAYRKGRDKFEDKCQPYIVRDYTKLKPMEIIVGDYMTQDFMVRVKDNVWRAKVVGFEDMRSRAIVGWSLQLTANSTGVALALQKCFNRFGLPKYIYFDNGREFKNHWICGSELKTRNTKIDAGTLERSVGIVAELGVKVIFAKPYNGKAKPIERFWRTLHESFDKGIGSLRLF
jgi:hypothetical protein